MTDLAGTLAVLTLEDADGRVWTLGAVLGPMFSLGQEEPLEAIRERGLKLTGIKVVEGDGDASRTGG